MSQITTIIVGVLLFVAQTSSFGAVTTERQNVVAQEGGQIAKLVFAKNALHVLSTSNGNLKIYKSTDDGKSFDSGQIISSNVLNSTEFELTSDKNGNLHAFWTKSTDMKMYYSKSTDGGITFSSPVMLTSGFDWADYPRVAISGTDIYLLFRAFTSPRSELYYIKSSDGGTTFSQPIRVTSNSSQEDDPSIAVQNGAIQVSYVDYYDSNNVYLLTSTNGTSFSSARVNKAAGTVLGGGQSMALTANGMALIAYAEYSNSNSENIVMASGSGNNFTYTYPATNYRTQEYPVIRSNASYAYVAWHDYNYGSGDVVLAIGTNGGTSFDSISNISNQSGDQMPRDIAIKDGKIYILATNYAYSPYAITLYVASDQNSANTIAQPVSGTEVIMRDFNVSVTGQGIHTGIDIAEPEGTPVYSICDGVVTTNYTNKYLANKYKNYWNAFLIIEHDCNGTKYYGYYGHIASNLNPSTQISAGQQVGTVKAAYIQDSRGRAVRDPSSDHLHFGLATKYLSTGWGYASSNSNLSDLGWVDPKNVLGISH